MKLILNQHTWDHPKRKERLMYILRRVEGFTNLKVVYNEKSYRVKAYLGQYKFILEPLSGGKEVIVSLDDFKPVLRKLDSMTKEESREYDRNRDKILEDAGNKEDFLCAIRIFLQRIDENNFDELNLIGQGYAISE